MSKLTTAISSDETEPLDPSSYCATVHSAHDMAELIKRTRPHLSDQVSELQATVTRCQRTLDDAKIRLQQATNLAHDQVRSCHVSLERDPEAMSALRELHEAAQALRALRHQGTTKSAPHSERENF